MLLAYHFLSFVLEHTFQERTNCKKKVIWSIIKKTINESFSTDPHLAVGMEECT